MVQVLILLCRCLHWFNPLFPALDRAFNAEAEKGCDDQVNDERRFEAVEPAAAKRFMRLRVQD
jgi:beta-lactamase regulating signal transducer with metallopeptidase domain